MILVRHLGEEKQMDGERYRNLEELVAAIIRSEAVPRIVERLLVNGVPVPEESLDALDGVDLESVETVEIESRTPREVARSSLQSCVEYADQLARVIVQSSELFRAGRSEEGNGIYADALDALWVLIYAMSAAGSELGPSGAPLLEVESDVQPWLAELLDAQTQNDWIRVADYLEYEIAPMIERWIGNAETALRETAEA